VHSTRPNKKINDNVGYQNVCTLEDQKSVSPSGHLQASVMPRLHQRNKLRATSCACARCLKQHVARNTQLVAGNKQLAARNMLLVARNKLRWCKRGISRLAILAGTSNVFFVKKIIPSFLCYLLNLSLA